MAQVSFCDLCAEIIKPNDKKFLFAYYSVTEEDEETRKTRYKEILEALYDGKAYSDNVIRVVETCTICAGVFAHFMSLRKKELIKARREVKKMFTRKAYKEKQKEAKKSKEKKK